MPINLTLDLALHQMVFALLTPIVIELVIPEPDPSLVILGLVSWAKQVADGVNRYNSRKAILRPSAISKTLTWQEHCYRHDHAQPPPVH